MSDSPDIDEVLARQTLLNGILADQELKRLRDEAAEQSIPLGDVLVERGLLDADAVLNIAVGQDLGGNSACDPGTESFVRIAVHDFGVAER